MKDDEECYFKKIRESRIFAIGFDQTTDMSKKEQIAITIRYMGIDNEISVVKEDFITLLSQGHLKIKLGKAPLLRPRH